MKTLNKRGWIFGGAAALALIGTVAQLTNTRAQTAAPAPTAASTNAAPAELPKLPADLSPGLSDVIKLVQSNVGDEVVVGYIKNSGKTYQPTADEIVYLNDLGVSQNVINALMQNGNGPAPVASAPQNQIPTPPSNATLSSPEVPTYNVTQDAPLDSVAQTPPPDVPAQAPATTTVVEQTPPPEVTVNYFYDSLSPYGTWVDVEGYGRCWRPSVAIVNAGWRPYCDNGYWVNTDCGWYWRSYYSWGWAPFHYGRWCTSPRFGWVWVPDCTWGPAWVAWREHDRYCGWAPLPPYAVWHPGVGIVWSGGHHGHAEWGFGLSVGAFTFVAYDHFTDHHPWRHQAPHGEVVNIYNHSTIIKNTVIVNNKTIINNGISKEKIVSVTHKPVQTVALRDSNVASHGRMEHVGNKPTMAVYRPSPTTIAKVASTPAVHNKPVYINNAPRTGSANASSHSSFSSSARNSTSYSPISSPKASTHDWASTAHPTSTPQTHQNWPGQNANSHFSPAEKVASASHERSSFEPNVHSTPSSKTVEQPNNYYGSGAYQHHATPAPSYTPSHASPSTPSYTPSHSSSAPAAGHSNFGGAAAGTHGGGGGGGAGRFDNNGHNR